MSTRRGFTLIELVMALGITGIILAAALSVAVQQQRFYTNAADVAGARGTLTHMELALAAELLPLNASAGDLLYAGTDSMRARLFQGVYSVCDKSTSPVTLTVKRLTKGGSPTAGDSALVYSQGPTSDFQDDAWEATSVTAVSNVNCPDGTAGVRLTVLGLSIADVNEIPAGAPLRVYSNTTYWFKSRSEGWFLERRTRDGSEVTIAGPLLAPDAANPGLKFTYLDANGNTTSVESQVAQIQIDARATRKMSGTRSATLPSVHRKLSFKLRND